MSQPLNPNDFDAFTGAGECFSGLADLATDFDFDYFTGAVEPPKPLLATTVVPLAINSTDTITFTEAITLAVAASASDDFTLFEPGSFASLRNAVAQTPIPFGGAFTTWVVTLPTYLATDYVFISIGLDENDFHGVNASAPGWTQMSTRRTDNFDHIVLYRKMDGSEGSTVTVTFDRNVYAIGGEAASYKGVDQSFPFDGLGDINASSALNGGFTTVATVTAHDNELAVLLAFHSDAGSRTYSPSDVTERWNTTIFGGGRWVAGADAPIEDAGTSASITLSYGTSANYAYQYFLLRSGNPNPLDVTVITAASDSIAFTEASNTVSASTPTAKSSSDSFTETDNIAAQPRTDTEVAGLSETEAVSATTPTAKSSSDSAAETENQAVTVPVTPASSDSATLSENQSIVIDTLVSVQDNDGTTPGHLIEGYELTAILSSSDSAAETENDGGTPGGGGAGNGGGTGAGGGPGVIVVFGSKHGHHPHSVGVTVRGTGTTSGSGSSSGSGGGVPNPPPAQSPLTADFDYS